MCGFTQNNCRCQCAGLMRQTMLNTFKGYFDQFLFMWGFSGAHVSSESVGGRL